MDEARLLARACSDRTGGNGFKLKECGFSLDMRKKVFTVRVVRHWSRLCRDMPIPGSGQGQAG